MDQLPTAENPYSAPQTFDAPPPLAADEHAEVIRKAHIKNEASIKSIGILYYLGAVFMILGGVAGIYAGFSSATGGSQLAESIGVALVLLILGTLHLFVGMGIRKLRPWARIVCIILAVIGLLGFPVGTLVSAYMLYLLLNKKATMIFSPGYKEIIAATPHVKYKTSKVVWILLILVILLFVAAIFGLVLTSPGAR